VIQVGQRVKGLIRIQLKYATKTKASVFVEGEWSSTWAAIEWAQRKGAIKAISFAMKEVKQ